MNEPMNEPPAAVEVEHEGTIRIHEFNAKDSPDLATMKKIKSLFRWADRNNDGVLQVRELENIMVNIGLARRDTRRLIKAADINKDGVLSIDEFLWWIFSGSKKADLALRHQGLARSSEPYKHPGPED
mmetsp:Transcript_6601/g.21095  ORF Transcript_6601/g.21095 Transcript_6601/m.21095 type:complete len:128 (+) Transcript_6601:229-612(+)